MIRYRTSPTEVEAKVDAVAPTWRERAQARTQQMIAQGRYEESSAIWSEVKPVFMAIQHNKCAYCEQQLEGGALGAIAHDLEHFRPKRNVRAWPSAPSPYPFSTGAPFPEGYPRLAYHLGNYLAACKVCNTLLKSDFFPIAGDRIGDRDTPAEYAAEQPFLVYPLGDEDENPRELITFEGVWARPLPTNGLRLRRAVVTIDFFGLNREWLHLSRARTLLAVRAAFRGAEGGDPHSRAYLDLLLSDHAPHANCARAFASLGQTDKAAAQSHITECLRLVRDG